jgi:Transposase DDE domain group 1
LLLLEGRAETIYKGFYCARAANQIKQMTLDLKAGRTSTHWMASNQMRLWFSAFAYMLLERLRAWGLGAAALARVNLGTIRLRLLKVAASVTVSETQAEGVQRANFPLGTAGSIRKL